MNKKEQNELDELVGASIEVKAGGQTLAITPIKVKELGAFTRAIAPMVDTFNTTADQGDLPMKLIIHHAENLIEAVAVGARVNTEWVNGLELDELAELVAAVIEVNVDFFSRRVLPKVQDGAARLNRKLNPGPMPTLNSGATG